MTSYGFMFHTHKLCLDFKREFPKTNILNEKLTEKKVYVNCGGCLNNARYHAKFNLHNY